MEFLIHENMFVYNQSHTHTLDSLDFSYCTSEEKLIETTKNVDIPAFNDKVDQKKSSSKHVGFMLLKVCLQSAWICALKWLT